MSSGASAKNEMPSSQVSATLTANWAPTVDALDRQATCTASSGPLKTVSTPFWTFGLGSLQSGVV